MDAPAAPTELSNVPAEVVQAARLLLDRKATDVVLLDLREISTTTDFFLIASGRSDVHVVSTAEHLIDELRKEGLRPSSVEGGRTGYWVLVDYFDFVVHVFHPAARDFYRLERLWGDAPAQQFDSPDSEPAG